MEVLSFFAGAALFGSGLWLVLLILAFLAVEWAGSYIDNGYVSAAGFVLFLAVLQWGGAVDFASMKGYHWLYVGGAALVYLFIGGLYARYKFGKLGEIFDKKARRYHSTQEEVFIKRNYKDIALQEMKEREDWTNITADRRAKFNEYLSTDAYQEDLKKHILHIRQEEQLKINDSIDDYAHGFSNKSFAIKHMTTWIFGISADAVVETWNAFYNFFAKSFEKAKRDSIERVKNRPLA